MLAEGRGYNAINQSLGQSSEGLEYLSEELDF